MADKGKGIADDDYSSAKRKYNRKRIKPNFEDSDSSDDEVFNNVEDSSDDEDFIEDISNSRKTCSANKGNEVNKPKRGRPRKSQTNIDSTASPASDSASPASNKRGRPKKSQPNNASTPSAASDSASPATSKKGKVKLGEKKDKNTIRTRTSPKVLYKVMKKLTLGQRKDLIDMGFGSLYDMAVEELPGRIGLFVVENLVPEEMKIKIKLKNYDIQISPDLIHEMLGVPIGGLDIKNLVKNKKRKKYSISETWYSKFPKTTPTPRQVARFINETQVEGIMFKLSILVLFSNVMGLAGAGGRCRPQQILDYITEETKIGNIDWCKYVFDCLKVSKKNWNKDNPDSCYTGPLVALILIYIHSTKCVTDSIPHEIPAINYWSYEKIRERDNFEFDNGGFGNLDLYEKDNNDKDSSENKLDMDKLHQNVDLLEKILFDIKNEFKLSSSKNPDNPRLKELKAKFNNCIGNEYLSGEDMMDKGERENDETMGFETENEDLDEEREKDEKTGFENKNDDFCNVHLSDDDLGNNDSGEERQKNESTGFEKNNVDDYDSIGKDENENENSDDDDLVFEKESEGKGDGAGEEVTSAELNKLMSHVQDGESSIPEPAPLDAKHPIISYTFRVRDGSEGYWEFKRSDNKLEGYVNIFRMLDSMDRDDVVAMWRLYKEKFGSTPPENDFEKVMYHYLRIMFDPHITDREWIEMRNKRVNRWCIYQSCGVHELSVGGVTIFLLTDKDYPGLNANKAILTQMVKPGFLQVKRHFMSDHQAYKLLQKYEKILDPSIRKSV